MDPVSASQQHGCNSYSNDMDGLGDSWRYRCECGWETEKMINMVDAVTMFGLHCMDVAFSRRISEEKLRADLGLSDDRGAVRRNWFRFLQFSRHWGATEASGPRPVPRHYVARFHDS